MAGEDLGCILISTQVMVNKPMKRGQAVRLHGNIARLCKAHEEPHGYVLYDVADSHMARIVSIPPAEWGRR